MTLANGPRASKVALATVLAAVGAALVACPSEQSAPRARIDIQPAEGTAGTDVTVFVRGSGTRFDAGDFDASIAGADVSIIDQRPDTATAARLVLRIDQDAAEAAHRLTIRAGGKAYEATFTVHAIHHEISVVFSRHVVTPGAELDDVHIAGSGTHFAQGVTTLAFPEESRIRVSALQVNGPTSATASISVDPSAPGGVVTGAVATRREVAYDELEVLTEAAPSLTAEPLAGFAGQVVDVSISGAAVDFGSGDDLAVRFAPEDEIDVSDLEVLSRTRLRARFTIGAEASSGARRFTAGLDRDGDGQIEEVIAQGPFFVVSPGAPSATVLPNSVHRDATTFVWVKGRGTAFAADTEVDTVAGSGVSVTGVWILGSEDLAVRLHCSRGAILGSNELLIDDGVTDFHAPYEVLEAPSPGVQVAPGFVERGAKNVALTVTGTGTSFERGVTIASSASGSGIGVSALTVIDQTSATLEVTVLPSAPEGLTSILFDTRDEHAEATLTLIPPTSGAAIDLDPPVVRAGLGQVEILATGQATQMGPETRVTVSDPGISILGVEVDEQGEAARLSLDVTRAARPGTAVLVLGQGPERLAARLQVLAAPTPVVTAAPSLLAPGDRDKLVLLLGVDTSFLPEVTLAAAPVGRGILIEGLTVIDRSTAVLEVTTLSDAPAGPAGVVLATHGEVAAAAVSIAPSTVSATMSLAPDTVLAGEDATLTVMATGTDFTADPISVTFPASLDVHVRGVRILDADTLEVDVSVDVDALPGTRPCRLQAGALALTAGLVVQAAGEPIVRTEPMAVRRGETTVLQATVTGIDLELAAPSVRLEPAGAGTAALRLVDSSHADVEVTVDPAGVVGLPSLVLMLEAAGMNGRQYLVLNRGPQSATIAGSVEAGTSGTSVTIDGPLATFSPGETLLFTGDVETPLHFGPATVTLPTELSVPIDVSANAETSGRVLLVTGPEVAIATLDVRRSPFTSFESGGSVTGTLLDGLGALLTRTDPGDSFLTMRVEPEAGAPLLRLSVLGPTGFAALVPAVPQPSNVTYPVPPSGIARIEIDPDAPASPDPVAFSFTAQPVALPATTELEPNGAPELSEPLGDPIAAPHVVTGAIDPTADIDFVSLEPSAPAAIEIWARRLAGTVGLPDVSLEALGPLGTIATITAELGGDPVLVLLPPVDGPVDVGLQGLCGTTGPYLAVVRSAVVIDEVGWSPDPGFVDLRAIPLFALDAYSLQLQDDGGGVLAEVDLSGVVAGESGLALLSADALLEPDLFEPDLIVPADGRAVLLYQGTVVDVVAYGTSIPGEGEPAEAGEDGAIHRTLGIDRNDNVTDFAAAPGSPGAD